jgi:hypothetical protein
MAKIKVFSAKTEETYNLSSSLFGEELTLKHIFNNQSEKIKFKLWDLLLNMYIQLERVKNNNQERLTMVKDGLKKLRHESSQNIKNDMFKNILKTDVNGTTNNMLDDIIGSFQSVVSNKGNPFENIMGITQMITNKYGSKIENGEVEIDKILGGMSGLLNKGMGDMLSPEKKEVEPVVMDENFSTADVEVGKEEEEKKEGGFNLSKLMPLANMVNKIGSIKSEEDIKLLKQDMDNFMEKELKVDMGEYKENIEKLEKQLLDIKLSDQTVEKVDEHQDEDHDVHQDVLNVDKVD